jgi:fatty-acyl-CoA synthase
MDKLSENLMRRAIVGDFLKRSSIRYPGKIALVNGDIRITYAELNTMANRFANAMLSLGVQKGDRVAIMSHNCYQYLACFFGLSKIGAVLTPLNFALRGEEIEYIIRHSEAKIFIVEDSIAPHVNEIKYNLPSVKLYISINLGQKKERQKDWIQMEDLLAEQSSGVEPEVIVNNDDPVCLLYTSGTESRPKGVIGSNMNYYSVLLHIAADIGLCKNDIFLVSTPLFHVAALTYQAMTTLALGGTVILNYIANIQNIMNSIEKEKVTVISLPSTIYIAMSQSDESSAKDMSSVRICYTYGAPMPSTVLQKVTTMIPGAKWYNYYGMTELSPLGTSNDTPLLNPECIGMSHLPLEMKVVDDNNNDLPVGEVGEIVARGPAVMLGYYKDAEKTDTVFSGGWLHTGDMGRMDEAGRFYFIDRKKDVIKSGGENVSSQEVEEFIFKHPKVAQVAVIGIPDPYWMETVAAIIVIKQGDELTSEEIIAFCKERLAGYKVPKQVKFVDDLPKNPSGKILKRQLREIFGK